MIVWPPELRADTPPRHVADAKLPAAENAWGEYEAAWASLKKRHKPPPGAELTAAEHALAAREPDVAAHAAILAGIATREAAECALLALVHELGAGFAFEAWLSAFQSPGVPGVGFSRTSGRLDERVLRSALLLANQVERARAVNAARDYTGARPERAEIVHRLVFDAETCRALAEQLLASPSAGRPGFDPAPLAIGVVPELGLAERLVRHVLPSWVPLQLTSLVDAFGVEAVPILSEVARGDHHAKDAVRALSIVGIVPVAELFCELLGFAPLRPRAIEFFARFPELSSVLEPLAREKTRNGKLAQTVLAALPKAGSAAHAEATLELPADLEAELKSGPAAAVAARLGADERLAVAKVLRARWQAVRDRKTDAWLGRGAIELADRALVARFASGAGATNLIATCRELCTPITLLALLRLGERQDPVGQAARRAWINAAKSQRREPDLLEEDICDGLERERVQEAEVELHVEVDATLEPVLVDASGAATPAPRAWSERSRELAKQMLADARFLLDRRPALYQRAMEQSRRWDEQHFRALLAGPLSGAFARSIVWKAIDGEQACAFRVAEDGSFAGDADHVVELPVGAAFAIAKPSELGERWQTIFEDYELVSPIGQLTAPPASASG